MALAGPGKPLLSIQPNDRKKHRLKHAIGSFRRSLILKPVGGPEVLVRAAFNCLRLPQAAGHCGPLAAAGRS